MEEPVVEEPYDFIGYDTGDNLIHVSGSLSTMFPADGGQIQVNRSQYVQGARTVSTLVFKDGNTFVLHFLEPFDEILTKEEAEGEEENEDAEGLLDKNKQEESKDEAVEKSEVEALEKEQNKQPKAPESFCDFSSFVAELSDGMVVTLSGYGPSGSLVEKESKDAEDTVTGHLIADAPPPQPTPSPQPKAGSPKARKRAEEEAKRMEEIQQQQEEERLRLEDEGITLYIVYLCPLWQWRPGGKISRLHQKSLNFRGVYKLGKATNSPKSTRVTQVFGSVLHLSQNPNKKNSKINK